jgi:glycosyltransferase involved in cell wall biosynthesis
VPVSDMDERSAVARPRVAIFQAFWRLHSSTVFTAAMLAAAGYRVDVFLFKVDVSLIPADMFGPSPDICVHLFEPESLRAGHSSAGQADAQTVSVSPGPAIVRWLSRIPSAGRRLLNMFRLWLRSDAGLIKEEIYRAAADIVGVHRYRAFIGIEKGGLIWAGAVARAHPVKLIYHNLELFTSDQWSRAGLGYRRMKAAEEIYHQRCWATIIQDFDRGRVLLDDNGIERNMKMIYLPVSRFGNRIAPGSRWLQTNLQLPDSKIIILNHGMISEDRFVTELTRIAQSFEENWLLVFHGWGWHLNDSRKSAQQIDKNHKVRFSSQLVAPSEEAAIVGSANVSLALYKNTTENDELTGFSSERIALSLQCGVPIVAFDYPSYGHIREEGCGVLIADIAEIPAAIRTIMADYSGYRARAFETFGRHYRFETNFQGVLRALEELPPS